jgi:HAD superfamily hydrolase (TIGR01493 family)
VERALMADAAKAILWDVGGTLVDFRYPTLAEHVRARLRGCVEDPDALSDADIARTHASFLSEECRWRTRNDERRAARAWAADLLGHLNLSPDNLADAGSRLSAYFDLYKPVEGITRLLAELRERGVRQAVVSNWPPSLPEFLDHHGLRGYFEAVVFSAEDGVHKPDEGIYRRAIATLGVSPGEIVFVGDNPEWDVLPTRAIGMAAIHFDPRKRCTTCEASDVAALRRLLTPLIV